MFVVEGQYAQLYAHRQFQYHYFALQRNAVGQQTRRAATLESISAVHRSVDTL